MPAIFGWVEIVGGIISLFLVAWFFIEREAGSIVTAVDRLIGDPSLTRSMGEAARAGVAAYTWDRIAARTRDVYAEVAEEKRALTRA